MRKYFILLSTLCLVLTSCEHEKKAGDKNAMMTMTPAQEEADRALAGRVQDVLIREEVLADPAKKIDIVIIDGAVILKGPVKNEEIKQAIEKKIKSVQGVKNVENQLHVNNAGQ